MLRREFVKTGTLTTLFSSLFPVFSLRRSSPRPEKPPDDKQACRDGGHDQGCNRCGPRRYWTVQRITEAVDTWAVWPGFTADTCGRCRRTANIPAAGSWCCCCGHYNILPWHGHQISHERPDIGPPRWVIHRGIDRSKWWAEQKKWIQNYQRVFAEARQAALKRVRKC